MDNKDVNQNENEHTFKTIEARPVTLKDDYDFFGRKWYLRILSFISLFVLKILIRFIIGPLFYGFRVKNKKILKENKKEGHIFMSNHIHPLDSFLLGTLIYPKKVHFTMLESNLGLPLFGKIFRILGGAPIPTKRRQLPLFINQMNIVLKKRHFVGIFPESSLKPYHNGIREFKKGAFRFAFDNEVAIIPMVFILKKPYGIYKLFKRKPLLELHILDRYVLEDKGSKRDTITYHTNNLENIVREYFFSHSNF